VLAPDGFSVAGFATADCPMPAAVCQTRIVLLDLRTMGYRGISPSAYFLWAELRWTELGLTYFEAECAPAGCPGPDRAGTWLLDQDGAWTKWSQDRLIDVRLADGRVTRAVLERTKNPVDRGAAVSALERVGDSVRALTPADVHREHALALLDDGRVLAWRELLDPEHGQLVLYADGKPIASTESGPSARVLASTGGWVYLQAYGGAPIVAYDPKTGRTDSIDVDSALAVAVVPGR
jgi:hypothetical protein